ncbi:putative quinol monooxygenase [Gillisia marina]|uniref:putative quinol monooxygenase n=1 Tax=Gillisia marina TaxID=1167637 RepID=UPI00029B2822|nr:antibiotic biosynthesis monooxygenase [Gillisia marina]
MRKQVYQFALLALILSVVLVSWNKPLKNNLKKQKNKLTSKSPLQTKTKSLIYHKVNDYGVWKKAFDDFLPQREKNGELSYEVGVLEDDPNTVYVFNTWKSQDHYKQFMENEELKEKMDEAGVTEPPTFLLLNKLEGTKMLNKKITGIIYHEIEDYDKWKRVFDDFERTRKEFKEVSYEVGTINGDSKMIYVMNQWNNLQDYKTFVNDAKLKEAMNHAGVIGKPIFLVFNPKEKG